MYWSLATLEVASASSAILGRFSCTHFTKSRASAALSKTKTGARCIESPITVHLTPPDRLSTFMPRLYDATSVPSVVAIGTMNSPCACSPWIVSGPAKPSGICATPVKFSMLPLRCAGRRSRRRCAGAWSPLYCSMNCWRALMAASP
jgi:hypothetical protein